MNLRKKYCGNKYPRSEKHNWYEISGNNKTNVLNQFFLRQKKIAYYLIQNNKIQKN